MQLSAFYDRAVSLSVESSPKKNRESSAGLRHFRQLANGLVATAESISKGVVGLQNVFEPAGMKNASFPLLPRSGVATAPMALPYDVEYDGERLYHANKLGVHHRRGGPTGNGAHSALDLLSAANALRGGRIVKPETLRLHSGVKPELGANYYGYGFAQGEFGLVGHAGGTWGVCARFGELSETPYTLVVLSHVNMNDCIYVAVNIQRVLAPNKLP